MAGDEILLFKIGDKQLALRVIKDSRDEGEQVWRRIMDAIKENEKLTADLMMTQLGPNLGTDVVSRT